MTGGRPTWDELRAMSAAERAALLQRATDVLRETGSHEAVGSKLGLDVSDLLAACMDDKGVGDQVAEYYVLRFGGDDNSRRERRAAQIVEELAADPDLAALVAGRYQQWAR